MASRPLTPEQRHQHAAFLKRLARTGNARQAAMAIGVRDSTLINRRKRHPAFALEWDRTLAAVDARLGERGGAGPAKGAGRDGRAAPGETVIVLRKNGRLQVCRARADAVTRAAEQRFLLALSATANVSLSAAAAGASPAALRNAGKPAPPSPARCRRHWRRATNGSKARCSKAGCPRPATIPPGAATKRRPCRR